MGVGRVVGCREVRDGEERVRAVVAAEHAGVTVSPGAFEADPAVPVAVVGEGEAGFAEGAGLESGGARW